MTAFHLCMAGDSNAWAEGKGINLLSYPEMNCHVQQLVLCSCCYPVPSPSAPFAYIKQVLGVLAVFLLGIVGWGNMKPGGFCSPQGQAVVMVVASTEVLGIAQGICFPSLQVTGLRGAVLEILRTWKKLMCVGWWKTGWEFAVSGELECVPSTLAYLLPGFSVKESFPSWLPICLSFWSPGQGISDPVSEGGSWKRTSHLKTRLCCELMVQSTMSSAFWQRLM